MMATILQGGQFLLFVFITTTVPFFLVEAYHHNCHKHCSICKNGVCTECSYGHWGRTCSRECSEHCWYGGCDKDTGRCKRCVPGRYTENCRETCPPNCYLDKNNWKNCDRETGKCLEGCSKGWRGNHCERKCGQGCIGGSCYQWDGRCTQDCKEGWSGKKCDYNINCLHGVYHNKICTHGCKHGLTGISCSEKCPGNCSSCSQYNHRCTSCVNGMYGTTCELKCPSNCLNHDCGMTRRCVKGCIGEFSGKSCEMPCPSNCRECDQDTGVCIKCKVGFTGSPCVPELNVTPATWTKEGHNDSSSGTEMTSGFCLGTLIFMEIIIPYLLHYTQ